MFGTYYEDEDDEAIKNSNLNFNSHGYKKF